MIATDTGLTAWAPGFKTVDSPACWISYHKTDLTNQLQKKINNKKKNRVKVEKRRLRCGEGLYLYLAAVKEPVPEAVS